MLDRISELMETWTRHSVHISEAELLALVAHDMDSSLLTLEGLRKDLARLSEEARQSMLCRSIETSTHFKWSLDSHSHRGLRVWLHAYKAWQRDAQHAASIHNHRYTFVSKILEGGYLEEDWSEESPLPIGISRHRKGTLNVVRKEEIHSLKAVFPGTVSLVVQLPARSSYSVVFRPTKRGLIPAIKIYDLEAHLEAFLASRGD